MSGIIVGIDGSDGSRTALRWAARTAAATGGTLRAVASWHYPAGAATPAGPSTLLGPDEMDQQVGDDLRALVREELGAGADHVDVEVGRGAAAAVLLATATRTAADMLVLGARGRGGFAGLRLGSVSQHCVEHASCPVVVLRADHEFADGPIVIGLDGSEGARQALEWTIDLAEATGTSIVAVHAAGTGANNATVDAGLQALDRWCSPIEQRGIDHQMQSASGDAREVLEQAAEAHGASLLVVGTRGLGTVRGLVLGSVAGYVTRYSTRPIAVVPPSTA